MTNIKKGAKTGSFDCPRTEKILYCKIFLLQLND